MSMFSGQAMDSCRESTDLWGLVPSCISHLEVLEILTMPEDAEGEGCC